MGDTASFYAPLVQNGKTNGELSGTRTLVQTSNQLGWIANHSIPGFQTGTTVDLWLTTNSFCINGMGSIQAQGERIVAEPSNPGNFAQVTIGLSHPIPIIRGTLQFTFAHGVLSTFRHSDGTYTQSISDRT